MQRVHVLGVDGHRTRQELLPVRDDVVGVVGGRHCRASAALGVEVPDESGVFLPARGGCNGSDVVLTPEPQCVAEGWDPALGADPGPRQDDYFVCWYDWKW